MILARVSHATCGAEAATRGVPKGIGGLDFFDAVPR